MLFRVPRTRINRARAFCRQPQLPTGRVSRRGTKYRLISLAYGLTSSIGVRSLWDVENPSVQFGRKFGKVRQGGVVARVRKDEIVLADNAQPGCLPSLPQCQFKAKCVPYGVKHVSRYVTRKTGLRSFSKTVAWGRRVWGFYGERGAGNGERGGGKEENSSHGLGSRFLRENCWKVKECLCFSSELWGSEPTRVQSSGSNSGKKVWPFSTDAWTLVNSIESAIGKAASYIADPPTMNTLSP
jgi:hypothetical protein